jgi:peptide/nickel transport system permease protein
MLALYVVRRVLVSLGILFGVTIITFSLLHATSGSLVPGVDLGTAQPEDVARIRHNLGLDLPLHVQYLHWIGGVVHGDFGRSLIDGGPVLEHITSRLPDTLQLTVTAMVLGIVISLPLGAIGAIRRGTVLDHFLTLLSVAGVSVPSFWLGLLMIILFSVTFNSWGLPWLPSSGSESSIGGGSLADRIEHLIMPATCLAFTYIAIWSRFTRSSMLEVLSQDYVRTARAKGMRESRVVLVHAFRNAIFPLITLVGLELPGLVSGAVIIEIVFSWPGIGRLLLERAFQDDYTMVLGLTTFAAILVLVGNLLADILYAVLDPRVRFS